MREIRNFKGKRIDNGAWVTGFYSDFYDEQRNDSIPTIAYQQFYVEAIYFPDVSYDNVFAEVDPETVGQFTGLKDIKKRDIYEGDTILVKDDYYIGDNLMQGFIGTVMFQNGSYFINGSMTSDELELDEEGVHNYQFEVMGNIHD